MRRACLISGFLVTLTLPVAGGDRLKLMVSPAQSFAPSILRIQVGIEPSIENRSLEVIANADEFYRSGEIQLDGDRAPATINFEFRSVPEGEYQVVGVLKDSAGHERSIAHNQVRVLARY
jgi:hypothetical protein